MVGYTLACVAAIKSMLFILYAASSILSPGCSVTGTIDGKFDSGYLVTVNLGADQLKGVGDYKILQIYLIDNWRLKSDW